MTRNRLCQFTTDAVRQRMALAIKDAGDECHPGSPAKARTGDRRRGRAKDTPVSQLSNSIDAIVVLSRNRGKSSGCEAREAKPTAQVVADLIPASANQGRNRRA